MKSTLFSGVFSCALACVLLAQGDFDAQQPQTAKGKSAEGIPVQYARACVHLAEIELKRAETLVELYIRVGERIPEFTPQEPETTEAAEPKTKAADPTSQTPADPVSPPEDESGNE